MSSEARQKIPVPRRFFLWSLNETSGEILTHCGPTEFTPSANDRIVRLVPGGGFEQAAMEARPFVVVNDGEYVMLSSPVNEDASEGNVNGAYVPGGNKEKDLLLGTKKVIPGPCAFPLWPGQTAEVRRAHKLSPNHYLLLEVVGPVDDKAPYYDTVLRAAERSQAVIDSEDGTEGDKPEAEESGGRGLSIGQRIVIQGRHTQFFVPPSGIEVVPQIEESESKESTGNGMDLLPPQVREECDSLVASVSDGLSVKQFSVTKNELRHRQDLTLGQRAIVLAALDEAFESRNQRVRRGRSDRHERKQGYQDPYSRRNVVLGPKEFCVLFDADGKARIVRGPARVSPGPNDTFMQRGSRRRVYDAYELSEQEGLWLRIVSQITRDQLRGYVPKNTELDRDVYMPGDELIIRGEPSVFFPFIESEVINPKTGEPHTGNDHSDIVLKAHGIDQKSGIYVRDLRNGMVRLVRGEASYLVDPRCERHVHRRVPSNGWNLWVGHAEPHKRTQESFVDTPWAVSITIPNNEACLITSRQGRRVEVGPKVVLLEYEETLAPLTLSKGPSKDGHQTLTTAFLRISGARVADSFEIESSDFVRIKLKLGFTGHFEASDDAGRERWFQVEDPVKFLADVVRARLRRAAREKTATELLNELPQLVDNTLLEGGRLHFDENGMVVDAVNVLTMNIADPKLAALFGDVQRESVQLQLKDQQSTRRLLSERHQDQVDAEENELLRTSAARKAETNVADAVASHLVERRKAELLAQLRAEELDRQQQREERVRASKLNGERERTEAESQNQLLRAQRELEATGARYALEEKHVGAISEIEKAQLRAAAEADAIKLGAVQKELVGALHAAADSEVMKAAAENMNLVALLGNRSPAEILQQLLRGTPLDRSTLNMQQRAQTPPGAPGSEGSDDS